MRRTSRQLLSVAITAAFIAPLSTVVLAAPAQAACYSTSTSTTLISANASVNYGKCKQGSTRSYARVGSVAADSGWHLSSTNAWAKGIGSREARAQVSSNIR